MQPSSEQTWAPYFARKFSASRFEVVMRVFGSSFYQREFGAHLPESLVLPSEGRNYTIFYHAEEWQRFEQQVFAGACRSTAVFHRYRRMIQRTQRQSLDVAQAVTAGSLDQLSWAELGRRWERWDRAHLAHFLRGIWIIFIIEPLLAQAANGVLLAVPDQLGASDELEAWRSAVFSPDQPNALAQERAALIELAQHFAGRSGNEQRAALAQHAATFGFIPCYDVIDQPWGVDHFQEELDELCRQDQLTIEAERQELLTKFTQRRRAFRQLLAELQLTKRQTEILQMAHNVTFLKDQRDDYRRRQSAAVRPLFDELARRADLPARAPLYLVVDEMREWFRTSQLPVARAELLARLDQYALIRRNDGPTEVYGGPAVEQLRATLRFATSALPAKVRGLVGNQGHVVGPARIVHTVHDLKKVQPGDVLVAVTTNPDFLSAMRRCVGFVTDEGGITSHAAIVARELNVPCVVGTRIATKAFQDGQVIELREGYVRRVDEPARTVQGRSA